MSSRPDNLLPWSRSQRGLRCLAKQDGGSCCCSTVAPFGHPHRLELRQGDSHTTPYVVSEPCSALPAIRINHDHTFRFHTLDHNYMGIEFGVLVLIPALCVLQRNTADIHKVPCRKVRCLTWLAEYCRHTMCLANCITQCTQLVRTQPWAITQWFGRGSRCEIDDFNRSSALSLFGPVLE
jgi:hypothetical protein